MVKSIVYTLTAIALCLAFFIWSHTYITGQFEDMHAALETLYDKIEDGQATKEDAAAVKSLWNDKKQKLHVFIPHNDISSVDYWLGEACGLLYTGHDDLALGKVEVLLEITKNLPDAYSVRFENVF